MINARVITPDQGKFINFLNPILIIKVFIKNRELVRQIVLRELRTRFRTGYLGPLWLFINPLIQVGIYWFVFTTIFHSRWSTSGSGSIHSALMLFSGLIAYNIFSDIVNRSPTLISTNKNLVKKVVFPLEILNVGIVVGAFVQSVISISVLLVMKLVGEGAIPGTVFLLPFVYIPLILFSLSISWFVAMLGVFVPDISNIVRIVLQFLFFLSAVFYPISAVPEAFQWAFKINPVAQAVEGFRDILVIGDIGSMYDMFWLTLISLVLVLTSYALFSSTEKAFSDYV